MQTRTLVPSLQIDTPDIEQVGVAVTLLIRTQEVSSSILGLSKSFLVLLSSCGRMSE
jgi:hypothetical protein